MESSAERMVGAEDGVVGVLSSVAGDRGRAEPGERHADPGHERDGHRGVQEPALARHDGC